MRTRSLPGPLTVLLTAAAGLLSGCATNFAPGPVTQDQTPIGEIHGMVHGGQAPVTSSYVYLFAASTSGYGQPAQSLLTSGHTGVSCTYVTGMPTALNGACYVRTDGNGNFALSGDYTCTAGQQVYMLAFGGNPGVGTLANPGNTAILQMAALGQCPSSGSMASQVPYLVVNEVTTVAFAYAVGGFATTPYNVSSDANGATGLANAFANASNIVNLEWGLAPTTANGNSNSTNPQSKLYTLADVLATCVNQSSSTSTSCKDLFTDATPPGGTAPAEEGTTIFDIVHNPTNNASAILKLTGGTSPFVPSLASVTDWTMPVIYKVGLGRASKIAFDSYGNAWINDREKNSVVKISPQGAVTTLTEAGVGSIYDVAVDPSNVVWALDYTNSQVYQVSTSGTLLKTITGGNLSNPTALAFSKSGQAFVTNASNDIISRFNSDGSLVSGTATSSTSLGSPAAIAVDSNGNLWIPGDNANCGCIAELAAGNTLATVWDNLTFILFGYLEDSTAIAIDGAGTPWVANASGDNLENVNTINLFGEWNYESVRVTSGLSDPLTLTVDGANDLWVANGGSATVSGFTNAGTSLASSGFSTGTGSATYAATPDNAGNLWTANSDGSVTQLLGLAAPTATPVIPGSFGSKP